MIASACSCGTAVMSASTSSGDWCILRTWSTRSYGLRRTLAKRPTRPHGDDIERYRIRSIAGPLPREEHLRLLADCNVFLAPRRLEGIGLSILEAMAMGLAVIAPDRPTMNEYIEHGVTGYLYDPKRPQMIDLRRAAEVGGSARVSMSVGRQEWIASRPRVLADVLAATPVATHPPLRIAAEARALTAVELAKASIPERPRSVIRRGRLALTVPERPKMPAKARLCPARIVAAPLAFATLRRPP